MEGTESGEHLDNTTAQYLASIREEAGLTQAEVAKKMTVSPAGISRMESGNRTIRTEEVLEYLAIVNTAQAREFQNYLKEDWRTLQRPPFDHPDRKRLWKADHALQAIQTLYEHPNLKYVFKQRVESYEAAIQKLVTYLYQREHSLAIFGGIGVGKTTTICQLTDLESFTAKGAEPALEVGGGGITLCEVHVKQGPQYGIIIEPCSDEEIRSYVIDFCDHLKGSTVPDADDPTADTLGISKEIIRAIRNMARLGIKKQRHASGRLVRHDPAKALAAVTPTTKELVVKVLAAMNLPRRDSRDFWNSHGTTATALSWLQETFLKINNGRHPDCTLPRRIDIIMPQPVLNTRAYQLRIVDTKGIDQTAERPDLEEHFSEPHTVTVLCSRFNDAPEAATQHLLQRARDARIQHLTEKASILVLPRPDEANAMKFDDGSRVDDESEGYELKREQVDLRLHHLGLDDIPVYFHNARTDHSASLRDFLLRRVNKLRDAYRVQLEENIQAVHDLIEHHEDAQRHSILEDAAKRLRIWVSDHEAISEIPGNVAQSLLSAIAKAHASTVRASIRREGNWGNLDYRHHLGFAARHIAASIIGNNVEALKTIAENLLHDEEYADAHAFIRQVTSVLENATYDFLRTVQLVGSTAYADDLKNDQTFWATCNTEWGKGSGYRDRVFQHNRKWFSKHPEHDQFVKTMITDGWKHIIDQVNPLLDPTDPSAIN